jgi:hypothetical protein
MQYLVIGNLEWDETSFVGKRTTRAISIQGAKMETSEE